MWKFEEEQGIVQKEEFKEVIKSLPTIYRLTSPNRRIYYMKGEELPIILNSGTTIIDNYKDKSGDIALEKWRRGLINDGINPHDRLVERQDYGTLLHLLYGRILQGEAFLYADLKKVLLECAEEIKLKEEYAENLISKNYMEFSKDVAAFAQWMHDYEVEPIGIEIMMASLKHKVATAIDLIAYITVEEQGYWGEVYKTTTKNAQKGDPKLSKKKVRKLVVVDFKSGKSSGFYPVNVLQLLLSRIIFEESLPEIKLEGVYNFAPNDWTSKPTYRFFDQERDTAMTDRMANVLDNVLERGRMEFEDWVKGYSEFEFVGSVKDVEAVRTMGIYELVSTYGDISGSGDVEEG